MNFSDLTTRDLRKNVVDREISAVEVATHFLDRIEERDPELGAFLAVDRELALADARKSDELCCRRWPSSSGSTVRGISEASVNSLGVVVGDVAGK